MKNKNLEQLKKNKKDLKKQDYSWIIKIIMITFCISIFFSFVSENILNSINIIFGIFIIFGFVIIGILFDMLGVAVTTADEAPFHSMNSRKVKGANVAVKLIKNASKVSSFCCDVVGDICGIISGSAGAIISSNISVCLDIDLFVISLFVTAIIASFTIGGKAFGKSIAINKSNLIIYRFSQILSIFAKK